MVVGLHAMRTKKYLLLFFMSLATCAMSSNISFDPSRLTDAPPAIGWQENQGTYKDEKYQALLYDHKEVFYVLPRFMPFISCIIQKAKEQNAQISLLDTSIIFFKDIDSLKSNLIIEPHSSNKVIILSPEQVLCSVDNGTFSGKKYYFDVAKGTKYEQNLARGSLGIEISKDEYQALILVKSSAQAQKKWLQITFQKSDVGESWNYEFITIPQRSTLETCAVCLENEKEILLEPCYHVCLCQKCSKPIEKCPICQQKITSKKRVYL